MAATTLIPSSSAAAAAVSSSCSSSPKLCLLRRFTTPPTSSSSLSFPSPPSSFSPLSALSLSFNPKKAAAFRAPAVAEQEKAVTSDEGQKKKPARLCELYVCNLPRSCDISDLVELFKPYGTVHSVEVSRDPETGVSRGCGYVTVGSVAEAKKAISALDGSNLGGREIRVKFSADMVPGRKNSEALTTAPKMRLIFESPHKAYVGNLAWTVRPEDLKEHFSQFGTVVSARMLYDKKGGKNRVYAFISFSSPEEVKAAIGASGSEFRGRELLVREVTNQSSS